MNKSSYEVTKKELIESNLSVTNSDYNSKAFGSWYVEVNTVPKHRLCLDGKDFRLFNEKVTKKYLMAY